jgi:hypothetical protein
MISRPPAAPAYYVTAVGDAVRWVDSHTARLRRP